MRKKILIISLFFTGCFSSVYGQSTTNDRSVESLDSIIKNLYNCISGDKMVKRDWNFMRKAFHKDARLTAYKKNKSGEFVFHTSDVEEYITKVDPYIMTHAFFEREISRKVDLFGPIAQVFSTYASFDSGDKNAKPFDRGINSIQLLNDGKRWWIISLYWTDETPENPIPKQYLPKE